MKSKYLARVYNDAANIIVSGGWSKAVRKNMAGEHCIVGAVQEAVFGVFDYDQNGYDLGEVQILAEFAGKSDGAALAYWNDDQDGPRPIVDLLLRAAEACQ